MNERAPHSIPPSDMETLRALAEQAAGIGGAVAREAFGRPLQVSLKSDQSEVTEIDVAAEKAIIDFIRNARPADGFLGEESLENQATAASPVDDPLITPGLSGITWIIDPIDGTRNFIRNMPLFACSVAAMHNGVPIAGAIFEPIQDVMYSARRGGELNLNRQPFSPDNLDRLSANDANRKLYVGIPSARREATKPLVLHVIENHVVRNFGSVALHLALAALGHLDAVVVGNAKLWDIAAGCLLVEATGGLVTAPDGAPLFPIDLTRYGGEEMPLLAGSETACKRLQQELDLKA